MDIGVEINQYLVVEHIGRGGMADVWSARDQKLNRMVAIKTIAKTLSSDTDPVGMFKQEAQTIAKMEHPHILPIYDFGEFEGQLYIVMRYVAGGSLDDLLRRGPAPLNEALRLGQAVAQALDFAHKNQVIHLDLKPPNVLLDSHQSPYLADFGLATALDPEGKAVNPGAGTLLYMAPEQLTAETIDHRADIYSFAIVMYHVLTGEMPFDATVPLALKQMQFQEELTDPESINPSLPSYFGDVLRRATALDPDQRHGTLVQLVDELREIVEDTSGVAVSLGEIDRRYEDDMPAGIDYDGSDMAILEAVDIYSRARHNWAGGNGRFLLGVTHFMLMNSYYMDAELHGLDLDIEGVQMLLRGALEYDNAVEFWWARMGDDDNRRWVCLHALRSGNAPARVRALYRLETLSDSETPQIPRLVAQALQIETNEEARLAALQVLGTRAKLIKPQQQYDIKTEYRGRMLTSFTRLGIQIDTPQEWLDVVYSPEIDALIAEIALDLGMPKVAEFAARIVGRIRSKAAVAHIAEQQKEGRRGALRALALIRDEAPSLPPVVSAQGRAYAWSANTLRRMGDQPLNLVFRFAAALLGGWLAMGYNVFATFRTQKLFTPQRLGNSMAIGLVFGAFVAFAVVFADEFSSRLRGFWPWWMRLISSAVLGVFLASLTWAQYTYFYLQYSPPRDVMWFGGFGLALGFVLTALFNLRSWIAVPLTALTTYIPIYLLHQYWWEGELNLPLVSLDQTPLLYYDVQDEIYGLAIIFVVILAIGGHLPSVVRDLSALVRYLGANLLAQQPIPVEEALPDPIPAPLSPAPLKPLVDPGELKTEMDASLGDMDAQDQYLATEMDMAQGIQYFADEESEVSATQRVDMDTGISVGDTDLRTEMDANLGIPDRPQSPPDPEYDSDRVDKGTGIRIDDSDIRTEFDVNLGIEGEPQPTLAPEYDSDRIDKGTGIRVDAPEMKTELDVDRAVDSDTDVFSRPSPHSHRVDQETGIRVDSEETSETETDQPENTETDED